MVLRLEVRGRRYSKKFVITFRPLEEGVRPQLLFDAFSRSFDTVPLVRPIGFSPTFH